MFIDYYSAKCLLGRMSKEPRYDGNLFFWSVLKKNHFVVLGDHILNTNDIATINSLKPISFHYLSDQNVQILKENFKISKTKLISTVTHIDVLKFTGKKNRRFRNYLNRYQDFTVENNFRNLSDIKKMLSIWSETSGDKYFRNFAGKNYYFFEQNFHKDCNCVFIYNADELVAFGVSSPVNNNRCSYIIGKALCLKYPGLSEFTDIKLYEYILRKSGPFSINLGQAMNGLKFYKAKFPNTTMETHFDGKVKI